MNKKWVSEYMAYLGRKKSPRKTLASQRNGRLGGRPKKK